MIHIRFTNDNVSGQYDIKALDGHTALKQFSQTDTYKQCPIYKSKGENYSGWSMQIICQCGNVSSYAYCSETCYKTYYLKTV